MKRVLVLNGSPKAASDTMVATRAFLRGLESGFENDCLVEVVDVIKKNIQPCLGCFTCWKQADGHCAIYDDDQNEILNSYVKADIIVWSFPLYVYAMPSHLKAVLDRTIPLNVQKMVVADGEVRHETLVDFSRKKTAVISGCGFPDWENNFAGVRIMCKNAFRNPTMICLPEAPMLNAPEAKEIAGSLIERFCQAGRKFAQRGSLCNETVANLEAPMIPAEAYLAVVNGGV